MKYNLDGKQGVKRFGKQVIKRFDKQGVKRFGKIQWLLWGGLGVMIFMFVVAPGLWPFDPYEQVLSEVLQGPDASHWLGTDQYGRDMVARILAGGRVTVGLTLAITVTIAVMGTLLGIMSAYMDGFMSRLITLFINVALAVPSLGFALAIAAVLGGGMGNAALALICVAWPKYARLARSLTLQVKAAPYIKIASLQGQTKWGIFYYHIMPQIAGPLVVTAVLDIGVILMELAGLSFLGLGAMPPMAEWGSMLSLNRSLLQTAPWLLLAPGGAIVVTVAYFHYVGENLRQYFDKI
ncbi:ABC transporter permease [Veillonella sp.]|uniref:ABC transporter permease n=1 Tax=Veillonella sp. TaxID=1926307 RepID=UPI0025FD0EB4|nr:ABC transporter permease [Veillonella sp.]